jgi:hypothetical protein
MTNVTGTYELQTTHIKYYRNETDPTCLLCGAAEENVLHFILQCEKLQSERVALLSEINAGLWFFVPFRKLEYLLFLSREGRNLFPEYNIRLYDKNSESDYYWRTTIWTILSKYHDGSRW